MPAAPCPRRSVGAGAGRISYWRGPWGGRADGVGGRVWGGGARKNKTPQRLGCGVLRDKSLTMTYFHRRASTIIGAKAFHCPVRDGKEWYHLAMVVRRNGLSGRGCGPTAPIWEEAQAARSDRAARQQGLCLPRVLAADEAAGTLNGALHSNAHNHQGYRIKPHGQLVSVSLTHYCASTPDLSTSWSRTTLQGDQVPGIPNLQTSFPLRCLQRLSLPYLATRQCHWHDNRYTRGTSTPVLSY